MGLMMKREVIEDLALIGGLIGVQFVYAGNSVLLSYLMSIGITPLTLVIFSASATFLVLSPLSFYFERNKWPNKLTLKLALQLLLISFAGISRRKWLFTLPQILLALYFVSAVCDSLDTMLNATINTFINFMSLISHVVEVTLFQTFFLKGIELTSPAIATAMPNLAPGFIFIIAWTFRLEKVNIRCRYSKVKILGTILCVIGALTMSVLQNSTAQEDQLSTDSAPINFFDKEKIIGCVYLLAAVLVLSANIVLQAATLGDFPAPISLCAITSLIGVVITICVQMVQEHKLHTGWPLVGLRQLLGFSLLGGTVSGACVSFNGWAMKKRGPVLVSMFSPIATVLSVVFSVITLGDTISFGSLGGMFLMFTGLYFVLWAKGKEGLSSDEALESEFDPEKPLLC